MDLVERIARALGAETEPSEEVIRHCEAIIIAECGPGVVEELREAGEDLFYELLAEQEGDDRYGGDLAQTAHAWAEEHNL